MSEDEPDEGDSTPSVPNSGGDGPGTDDSTGLSGQPDADEFEGATDWSDVEESSERTPSAPDSAGGPGDSATVDSETRIDTPRQPTEPQGTSTRTQPSAQGDGTGRAHGSGHAGGAGRQAGTTGTGAQRGPDEKYCSNCGAVISQQAVVCPECGVEQADAPQQADTQSGSGNGNDPGVAALLSGIGFFVPILTGAGQVYNGQIAKGILFTLIQLLNVALAFVLIGLVTYPVVGILAIYDAYKNADG
ncbi:MAG: zinc ribbon domain-containing protein [Haloarculaceae archaeon]